MGYFKHKQFEERGFNEDAAISLMLEELSESKKGRATVKGIEIGVGNGERVHTFCAHSKVRHTGIDNLKGDGQNSPSTKLMDALKKQYDNFYFVEGDSQDVVDKFDDDKYDYVFIDGSHDYQDVAKDFVNYAPKLKKGGYLLIHDSRADEGIKDAVTGAHINWHTGPTKLKASIDQEGELDKVGAVFSLTIYQV